MFLHRSGQTLSPGVLGGATAAVVDYRGTANDTSNLTTYTFSAQDIGDEASNRVVAVGIMVEDASTSISSATIGGVAATVAVSKLYTSSAVFCAIIYVELATGTTADIVVTFEAGKNRCAIGVWRVLWAISATPTTASAESAAGGGVSATLNVNLNGVVVAVGTGSDHSTAVSWTGATERYDNNVETALRKTGADLTVTADETPRTFNFSSGGANEKVLCVAQWR